MPVFTLLVSLFLGVPQAQPVNTACSSLLPAEVSALIGSAKTLPVTATSNGGSCMFQNGDKIITVLTSRPDSAEGAQGLWNGKKRIVAGADVPGWAAPAYFGMMGDAAVVGLVKGTFFIEVKAIDKTQKPDALGTALKTVMKAVASRLK